MALQKLCKETNEDFNVVSFEFLTFAVAFAIAPPEDGWGLKRWNLIAAILKSLLLCWAMHTDILIHKETLYLASIFLLGTIGLINHVYCAYW